MKWFSYLGTREGKRFSRIVTILTGCGVCIAAGIACLRLLFAEPLARASYDIPLLLRNALDTHEIVLVFLDDESAKRLHQPVDAVWNRALHVQLLDRLTQDGAKLVFYDVVFDQPGGDAAGDEAFAKAIQRNGNVVLGAAIDKQSIGNVQQERVLPPLKNLRKAARGWGTLVFMPVDRDYSVRQIFTGGEIPSATWRAAELLGAPITNASRTGGPLKWVNYYGPPNSFASVKVAQALASDEVPPGFFRDKIVMIGALPPLSYIVKAADEFRSPWSRFFFQKPGKRLFMPGLEVHANILLNFLRGNWLTEMPLNQQAAWIVFVGILAGALSAFRPLNATLLGVAMSLVISVAAVWLVWHRHIWTDWIVPSAVQIPLGIAWAVGSQYVLETRRRKELRRAFGFYLSPHMADRIADSDFDLRPGGRVVEATVIFTDLENFTTISEKLDPQETSSILTDYFGQTTRCILANNGTIIKYIGDAVFAAWGAPIEDPQHAARAAEAACDLRCLTELQIRGKRLRTRIGIHSGRVLAGNLGSEFRFDYTMIGDAVNFASRLESLNKYVSTQVLISDAVKKQLPEGRFVTRRLGEFKVAGKTESVVIHELVCRCEALNGERQWIEVFEDGVEVFRAGEFAKARDFMERTRILHGGTDGPAEFYLRKIANLESDGARDDWTGIVELTEK